MFKDPWFYFFAVLIIILLTAWGFHAVGMHDCNEKGGTFIKTAGGYECVRLEKIK